MALDSGSATTTTTNSKKMVSQNAALRRRRSKGNVAGFVSEKGTGNSEYNRTDASTASDSSSPEQNDSAEPLNADFNNESQFDPLNNNNNDSGPVHRNYIRYRCSDLSINCNHFPFCKWFLRTTP